MLQGLETPAQAPQLLRGIRWLDGAQCYTQVDPFSYLGMGNVKIAMGLFVLTWIRSPPQERRTVLCKNVRVEDK